MERAKLFKESKRLVVKLGTAVLMGDDSGIALDRFRSYIESIAGQIKAGRELLLVTSGAIGLGMQQLKPKQRPKLLPQKQACAAVGQGHLMSLYSEAFDR